MLTAPQFDKPFTLQVDASHVGTGAVLLQADVTRVERPVGFFSKKFNSYQLNYSVIEKEALALIWGLVMFPSLYRYLDNCGNSRANTVYANER